MKMGLWDFLPQRIDSSELEISDDMPGNREKLSVLAEHLRCNAGIWFSDDLLGDDAFDCRSSGDTPSCRKPR
jgi:hypothetical protein